MDYTSILFERKENYAIIKLNRPEKLNALNRKLFEELDHAVISVELDSTIRALIITGTGEKAFAAGADIAELNACNNETGKLFSDFGSKIMRRVENLRIPVIAAINGFALGGGCELTLSCHIRLAASDAKMGQPEINLGIIPGYGGTQRLTKIIGSAKAMELILTGDMIDANEAYRLGLVNAIYPKEELLQKAEELAGKLAGKAPIAIKNAIDAIQASQRLTTAEGLEYESQKFGDTCGSDDFKEGTTAFLEKRKPVFSGK